MSFYRGMTCENVTINGDKGTPITAYVAKPSGSGPFPGVVLVHHLPGWSEFYIETTRRFAHHGYLAICATLYERAGEGNPDDVAAKVRADGGIPDAQMVGDTEAAVKWMRAQPNHNGKVGLFGSCSGGRHAFIYACQRKDVDACAELWGGHVVMSKEELNTKTPIAPIDAPASWKSGTSCQSPILKLSPPRKLPEANFRCGMRLRTELFGARLPRPLPTRPR